MRLHEATSLAPVAAFHGIEQLGVFATAALLLLGEQIEVVARHDALGLAYVGEEPRRACGQVDGAVEVAVRRDHVVGCVYGHGEGAKVAQLFRRDARRRQLGPLAGERGENGEVVDRVLWGDPDHRHAAAWRDRDEPLVGQLEQRLADRGAADAELRAELVEVEPVPRTQATGEDPVAQLVGRLGPDGRADQFDI